MLAALATACGRPEAPTAMPGEPVPGLSQAALARFEAGRALFDRDFTEAEGLGPLFNQRRCSSCHDIPTIGGMGAELVPKATRMDETGCDLLVEEGGDLLQQRAIEALRRRGTPGEVLPPSATATANILPGPLYGLGLVDAVDPAAIAALADPDDRDGDGISGRVGRTADGEAGRFGRKADHATLADFTETALLLEMGLTSPNRPVEERVNGKPVPPEFDIAADPEVDTATVARLVDYLRFLALPSPEAAAGETADSIADGRLLFGRIGCTDCHVPDLPTGPADEDPLDRRTVRLYTDLLLHDLGPELASICGRDASPSEWRTPPLAGLRFRHALMHDGRTGTYERAIQMHGGEGGRARDAFERLAPEQKSRLLRFLGSL